MTQRLQGESILITGGASGLGRAIVERFVQEGAVVSVLDKSAERLDALQQQLGDRITTTVGDVRVLADHQSAVAKAEQTFGKLDCAIGNAGIWDFMQKLVDIPDDSIEAAFDELFSINVKGYLLLAKAAAPALVRSRGSLLFTLSNAAFYPNGGGPMYTASKHAGVGLVKQLAFELAPFVRVNAIAPGGINSDLRGPESLGIANTTIGDTGMLNDIASRLPIGKAPTPQEYTGAYVFFACRSETVPATGSILNYDGGIGVRGYGVPSGGQDLDTKFDLGKV